MKYNIYGLLFVCVLIIYFAVFRRNITGNCCNVTGDLCIELGCTCINIDK